MNDFTNKVARSVGRHFVTLTCVQHPPGDSKPYILLFSGFVVEVANRWFYITAGHILRDIQEAIKAGSFFDIWRLGDQTAGNHFGAAAIPYSFEPNHWIVLENEESGLDYAAVELSDIYRRQLKAGGVIPLASTSWDTHFSEHEYWALFGVPSESVLYDGETRISARVVMTPLIPAEAPPNTSQKVQNKFYAKLADGSEQYMKDIDGMSGGPVFSIKKINGSWAYSVIGVQSSWYPSDKVLAICPFVSFGIELEKVVQRRSGIALDKGRQ
jgi:hypothetical protein